MIDENNKQTIVKAICLVLDIPNPMVLKPNLSDKTEIIAEISLFDTQYKIVVKSNSNTLLYYVVSGNKAIPYEDFARYIRKNKEEYSLLVFSDSRSENYNNRFEHYKDNENYYPGDSFFKLTCGIGNTGTFRQVLKDFYKPNSENSSIANFFLLNDFWEAVETVRDYNFVVLPLIVQLKEKDKLEIMKSKSNQRQILIL